MSNTHAEIAAPPPAVRRKGTPRAPTQRSRVTNGRTLFADGGDMRTPWARRCTDLIELHLSDLGGLGATSEAERSIVRRAAVLTIELERMEARFADGLGDADDLDAYQRAANSLRRHLESIGLERRPVDAGGMSVEERRAALEHARAVVEGRIVASPPADAQDAQVEGEGTKPPSAAAPSINAPAGVVGASR